MYSPSHVPFQNKRGAMKILVYCTLCLLSGCATIFSGGPSNFKLDSEPTGAEVYDRFGKLMGLTPLTINLPSKASSGDEETVTIRLDDFKTARVSIHAEFNYLVLLNVLFTSGMGLPSSTTDMINGRLYKYDDGGHVVELIPRPKELPKTSLSDDQDNGSLKGRSDEAQKQLQSTLQETDHREAKRREVERGEAERLSRKLKEAKQREAEKREVERVEVEKREAERLSRELEAAERREIERREEEKREEEKEAIRRAQQQKQEGEMLERESSNPKKEKEDLDSLGQKNEGEASRPEVRLPDQSKPKSKEEELIERMKEREKRRQERIRGRQPKRDPRIPSFEIVPFQSRLSPSAGALGLSIVRFEMIREELARGDGPSLRELFSRLCYANYVKGGSCQDIEVEYQHFLSSLDTPELLETPHGLALYRGVKSMGGFSF